MQHPHAPDDPQAPRRLALALILSLAVLPACASTRLLGETGADDAPDAGTGAADVGSRGDAVGEAGTGATATGDADGRRDGSGDDEASDDRDDPDDRDDRDDRAPALDAAEADDDALRPGTLCAHLAAIQCEGEQRCCDAPGRDLEACRETMEAGCREQLFTDEIAMDPIAGFRADRAQAAFEELEVLAQACDPTIAAFGESVEGLRGIFAGTLAEGERCTPRNPLDQGAAAAALASCARPADVACLPRGLSWTCTPRADAGGACFSDVNCLPGLFCDNPQLSIAGSTCGERKPAGASCELPNECASLACRGGLCAEAGVQAAYCLR